MSVKRRLKLVSSQRPDIPHLRALESATTADFDDVLKGLVTGLDNPYVIRGFDIVFAQPGDSPNNIEMKVADSSLLHATATEPGTIMTIPASEPNIKLNPSNTKIIGSWASNAVNYVCIDYRRVVDPNSIDQIATWSQSESVEVQKTVPIGYILDYRIIITTAGFGNYLPLYKVHVIQDVGFGQKIQDITNAKTDLWRLGLGGLVPDPYHSFEWSTDENGSRIEGNLTQTGQITSASTFWSTGDFAIKNLKDNDSAIKTRIKEMTNSNLWYMDTNMTSGSPSLRNLWADAVGSVLTSSGSFSFTLKTLENGTALVDNSVGDYTGGYSTKLSTIYNGTGYDPNLIGLVRVYSFDQSTGDQLGQGTLSSASGQTVLLSSLRGSFSQGNIIRAKVKIPIVGSITRSGTVATINVPSYSLYDATNSIYRQTGSSTFKGSISGALDPAFNLSDVTVTITGTQTILTYTVSSGAPLSDPGPAFLDGYVFGGEMIQTTQTCLPADINTGTDTITITAHGFNDGDYVRYASTLTDAAPLVSGQSYYIVNSDPNTFQLALTPGGTAINITSQGTGIHQFTRDVNPTAGPVAWDQDLYVNSVIGPRSIIIAKEAVADDEFGPQTGGNGYGEGTFLLKADDRVAYILLERDRDVGGAGATYQYTSTSTVQGPPVTYTGYYGAQSVRVGDFIKFKGASDLEWRKVLEVTGTNPVVLTLDYPFSDSYAVGFTGDLLVTRGCYGRDSSNNSETVIHVRDRYNIPGDTFYVPDSADVYWLGYRKDKNISSVITPTVYLRLGELEVGETRQVNDNATSNLLTYTGAGSEAVSAPDYTNSTLQSGFEFEVSQTVSSKDPATNQITLSSTPVGGIQAGDQIFITSTFATYTILYPLDSLTAVILEDIQTLPTGAVKYRRPVENIDDGDNLTVAERKIDRAVNYIMTVLGRPVYDESVYVQAVDLTAGAGVISSGDYITFGASGYAWVLSGTGGETLNPTTGATMSSRILVHVYSGSITAAIVLTQGVNTRTTSTATTDVGIYGNGPATGQLIALPPNRRAGVPDNTYSSFLAGKVYPHATYRQRTGIGGGELLLVANDTPRECSIDFEETRAGPGTTPATRAQIRIIRTMPLYTRLRFRNLATYGAPPASTAGTITLQSAYNGSVSGGGNAQIDEVAGKPLIINGVASTDLIMRLTGITRANGVGSGFGSVTDLQSTLGFSETDRFGSSWVGTSNVKTHSNYTNSGLAISTNGVTTTGVASVLAQTITIPTNTAVTAILTAVARNDTGISGPASSGSFKLEVTAYREAGVAILTASPVTTVIGLTPTAYEYMVTASVSGNDLQFYVAGGTSQTVSWALTLEKQFISTSS